MNIEQKPPAQPMKLTAVVAGWATDIGSTILLSGAMSALLYWVVERQLSGSASTAKLDETVLVLALTPPLLLVAIVLGSMTTVLGGFVSAYVARRDEVWHALATGTLVLLTGLFFTSAEYATTGDRYPLWYTIIGLLLTFPCALLGGWLCSLRRKKPRPTV